MQSLRTRLLLAGAIVLTGFILICGASLEQAFRGAAIEAQQEKLRGMVFALLGQAELGARDNLTIADFDLPDARLSQPQSGMYAWILDSDGSISWQSPSALYEPPPSLSPDSSSFRFQRDDEDGSFIGAYGLKWIGLDAEARTFTLIVHENSLGYDRQLSQFRATLWLWMGVAAIGLLVVLVLVLDWVITPTRRLVTELNNIEQGRQETIDSAYPREIEPLTDALNLMLRNERGRLTRYRNAMGDLAHSLKTPLAVLHGLLEETEDPLLRSRLREQIDRIQQISEYQLSRAAATGRRTLSEPIPLRPIIDKTISALAKVYRHKGIRFEVQAPHTLRLRADDVDLYELIGNIMDNSSKWCVHQVLVQALVQGREIELRFEDDGPGFPKSPESLLARGARADERVPGQGLGLSAAAEIVSAYEGELRLDRSSLGGAAVILKLPV